MKFSCFLLFAFFSLLLLPKVLADESRTSQFVNIPLNKWASQRVLSYAIGQTIENSGNHVNYIEISADAQWGAFRRNALDFQLEVWEPSMKQQFEQLIARRELLDMGTHSATVIEDWWYPKYVEDACPELPNWQALNTCVDLFKTSEFERKGTYYAGPWDYGDADIIRALKINFTINRVADGTALWQVLLSAMAHKQPIMLLNWSPNWTDSYSDGEFVKFPAYTEECETNPKWGLNDSMIKDCGNRRGGWLKKAGTQSFKSRLPCVYSFIENVSLTKQMIADASAFSVVEKLPEKIAATKWQTKYQKDIDKWLLSSCM